MRRLDRAFAVLALLVSPSVAAAQPVIVAAENFYGDVARQIAGPAARVVSILNNPDQDPHLFEASPSAARAIAAARIVIYNGLGYDPWIEKLLHAAGGGDRKAIVVAELTGGKPGDNPHLWYAPGTMPALATALADALGEIDPAHRADYRRRLATFRHSLAPIDATIADMRQRFSGAPVAATEPVFGPMLTALGLQVRDDRFQRAVMNGTEPSASAIAGFEDDLKNRRVKLLIYNRQVNEPVARRMVGIAEAASVPVVPVSETEPPDQSYQNWIGEELDALHRALAR